VLPAEQRCERGDARETALGADQLDRRVGAFQQAGRTFEPALLHVRMWRLTEGGAEQPVEMKYGETGLAGGIFEGDARIERVVQILLAQEQASVELASRCWSRGRHGRNLTDRLSPQSKDSHGKTAEVLGHELFVGAPPQGRSI
jgi:hypothetical protein